ncbi:SDR family NAD(P)-dependent oxidoreductase [Streptomyces caelestis]|uniref:NAD(P)-dependent dehydrogenase (Short-subunit alcohol dehydrogenase family) n=1 Tax=Streptomyces caelestis TaxID=36816 RepID=A0A7W9GYT2_9ACTN|nr:SDR family NAD(P)-dependent oxidoreductase [Streptomyces caelestis]MBB5792502.1 NAD(P)-dependent dehydrogenase (short-subunit alcohol dehydrogenase family) [Streptomyces caelestis]GGW70835.1 short-chain dehydrogenase [Streptomyces caelestis]
MSAADVISGRGGLAARGKSVLVTGASSGLGRVCAERLAASGFRVFAAVRKEADGAALASAVEAGRIVPVRLDVTEDKTIAAAAEEIAETVGDAGLWGLVNNAGICVSAPLECVSPAQLRRQLDTNVVGQLAVTQALLPLLRRSRGRVVNVTSGLGSVAIPFLGAYASAQFAKEALTDVLRRELRPLGVDVSVVQPGAIMTPIWGKVSEVARDAMDGVPEHIAELYRIPFGRFLAANEQQARESRTTPEDFARTVGQVLTARRPRTRYRVGQDARRVSVLARVLPDSALDRYLRPITE